MMIRTLQIRFAALVFAAALFAPTVTSAASEASPTLTVLEPLIGSSSYSRSILTTPLFEDRLGGGATNVLRGVRLGIRKTAKTILAAAHRWRQWIPLALLFSSIALLSPLLDRSLLRSWQDRGLAGVRGTLLAGLAVYIRLLLDRRTPMLGKLLLGFAVLYGVAARDLVPDGILPFGIIEDLILITVAGRCFLRLCPDRLVEQHAARATRARVAAATGRSR